MRSAVFASVLVVALLVAGCGHNPIRVVAEQSQLPAVPDRYRQCFAGSTELPAGAWSAAVTADVVSRLRVSELGKTDCGQDFIAWYEDLRAGRAPKD